jgi:hypothetical protein
VLSGGDYNSLLTSLRPDPEQNEIIRESSSFTSIKQLRLRCSFAVLASADVGSILLDRTETITITRADDAYEVIINPGADPILVKRPANLVRVTQVGSATGLGAFIKVPDPIMADPVIHEQQPQLNFVDVSNAEKKTTWNYQMVQTADQKLDDSAITTMLASIARPMDPDTYGGDDA